MSGIDARCTNTENTLSQLLLERTGYELADLDREASFVELGFDSLFLIQLSQEIKQRTGVKVSFRELIEEVNTIDALVSHIADRQPSPSSTAPALVVDSVPTSTEAVAAVPVSAGAAIPASESATDGVARASSARTAPPTAAPSPASVNSSDDVAQASATPVAVAETPAPKPSHVVTPTREVANPPLLPVAQQQPAAMAQPRPIGQPSTASTPQSLNGIEQIILQQNALMAQHLAILQDQARVQSQASPTPAIEPPLPVPSPAAPSPAGCDLDNGDACAAPILSTSTASATQPSSSASPTAQVPAAAAAPIAAPIPPAPTQPSKHERFGPYKPVRRGANNGLTDQQAAYLSQFMERYTSRTANSRAHAESHRDYFADPRGVAGYRRIWKSMVYQIAVERSKGSKLWDIDGNEYVDVAMGFGLNLFGQSPDFVTKALHEQLDRGVEVGPQSPIAGEVAQLLCDFSRKERVTFCNTGSEAVMAALRLARTVTGKSKFVYFNKDYHGNFDQVLVRSNLVAGRRRSSPAAPGVPQSFADNAIVLDYGTPEALQVIQQQAGEIAAVLIEPVQSANPFLQPKEFLHEIRRITREHEIAMIMDEVITGFRAAPGGAQEWFDVWADMSTYGKILGGGMPIGALAGSRKYMDALDGGTWRYDNDSEPEADMTFFAGTFVRHPLGLTAALQVLRKVKEEGPELQLRLTEQTTRLVDSLNSFFEREQFPIRVAQFASQFRFMFPPDLEYADMLYFHMLDRGVFTRGWGDNCFLSTEHSEADVDHVIKVVCESCIEIRKGGFFPDAEHDQQSSGADLTENALTKIDPARATPLPATDSPASFSTLVEIQPQGDRTPLFCTPAADGFTRVYHELSDQLGPNQPVYGLDSPGIYGLALPDTLQELCEGFVREIREIQPHGPYQLVGYCSGGTVALEIAQQLVNAGEEVSMLAMIETYNWLHAPSTNPSFWTNLGYNLQRVDFHFRNFWLLGYQDKKSFVRSKWNALRVRTRVWRGSIASVISRKPRPKAKVNMSDLWRIHDELCEEYVPKPYPGKLIHFRPAKDYRCHQGKELEAVGGAEYHRMRSYPAGMMVSPFVEELARSMEAYLGNAEE